VKVEASRAALVESVLASEAESATVAMGPGAEAALVMVVVARVAARGLEGLGEWAVVVRDQRQ
jgi:hypothetical protein